MKAINFKPITLRKEISSRGGGIEISLDKLGYQGEKMTAYQNYLGGGILGAIQSSNTIDARNKIVELSVRKELDEISDQLKRHFHSLTVHDDEWEGCTYEENQTRPKSAY